MNFVQHYEDNTTENAVTAVESGHRTNKDADIQNDDTVINSMHKVEDTETEVANRYNAREMYKAETMWMMVVIHHHQRVKDQQDK